MAGAHLPNWYSVHVDTQPSPPTHRQMYSVDIQRSQGRPIDPHDSPSVK